MRTMKNDTKKRVWMKALAAGLLSCILLAVPAAASSPGEDSIPASKSETESMQDADAESEAGSMQDADAESETESLPDLVMETVSESIRGNEEKIKEMLNSLYTDKMREEVLSMSLTDITRAAEKIKNIISNPDFKSLFGYADVRELTAMLIHNALNFASDEPDLTKEILDTMGIDRKVVLIFFAMLDACKNHTHLTGDIWKYINSEDGKILIEDLSYELSQGSMGENLVELLDKIEELIASDAGASDISAAILTALETEASSET